VVDGSDRPIAGAHVSCGWNNEKRVETTEDGAFTFYCTPQDPCIVVRHPGYAAIAAPVNRDAPVVVVLPPNATLELRVTSTRGAAIPGATVWLTRAGACSVAVDAETNELGAARVVDAPVGRYRARAVAEGWADSDEVDVEVTSGLVTQAALVMPEPLHISGVVLAADGAPAVGARVKGCRVRGSAIPANGRGIMAEVVATVGSNGEFVLTGLSNTRYAVDALSVDGESVADMELLDAGTTGATLRFVNR
jgi:hypothetical protein